jgi:hypothetical protein
MRGEYAARPIDAGVATVHPGAKSGGFKLL